MGYLLSLLIIVIALPMFISAQATGFSYQGKLTDAGGLPTGPYDLTFRLFSTVSGGTQIGSDAVVDDVSVRNGIFTVFLDFGSSPFTGGTGNYLEISVRPGSSTGAYTPLSPRQPIMTVPYAVQTVHAAQADNASNAAALGGTPANQFVQTTDPRMSDARDPLPGSPNYIQNTTLPQPLSNFNISGNGTAGGTLTGNTISATTQFNIGGSRFLTNAGTRNVFAGVFAGEQNTSGDSNSFVGEGAGRNNTTGADNSFFGQGAGNANTTASGNSFFGHVAGLSNTSGTDNSFFGESAGKSNTTARFNSFFGFQAGFSNTTAENNSFFGFEAGFANTTGHDNAFFGQGAGASNTTANNNAFYGSAAGTLNTTGIQNAFFGANAGSANTTGSDNAFVGNGAGQANMTASHNAFFGSGAGLRNTTAENNSFFGFQAGNQNTTNVGIGTTTPTKRLHVVGDALINGSITANTVTANTVTANTVTSTNNVSVGGIVTAFIIRANTLEGIPVLKSSNGTCWALGVDDSGGLFTVQQAQCP